jgi:hypothetical protein
MSRKTMGDAFGGVKTTLEEQRAIWPDAIHEDAIHEDAIWEGPMFETPVVFIGFEAVSRFFEFRLATLNEFSTTPKGVYPTSKNGKAFRMREYRNPFQTYKAFGREHWEKGTAEIMARYNKPWPASQAKDPITLPPI